MEWTIPAVCPRYSTARTTRHRRPPLLLGSLFPGRLENYPNLTLNLGLRWDYFSPYSEINGRQANTVLAGGNGSTGIYYVPNQGLPGFTVRLRLIRCWRQVEFSLHCVSNTRRWPRAKHKLCPSRRLCRSPCGPTSFVRGGYGIAYGALANIGYGGTLGQNYPFIYNIASPSTNTSVIPITFQWGDRDIENTFGTINLTDPTQITGLGVSLYGRQYNYQTPYVQTFNLTLQDQFTRHDSFQIGGVGALGRHLDNYYNTLNSPSEILPPGTPSRTTFRFPSLPPTLLTKPPMRIAAYYALQATYEHQFSLGSLAAWPTTPGVNA